MFTSIPSSARTLCKVLDGAACRGSCREGSNSVMYAPVWAEAEAEAERDVDSGHSCTNQGTSARTSPISSGASGELPLARPR